MRNSINFKYNDKTRIVLDEEQSYYMATAIFPNEDRFSITDSSAVYALEKVIDFVKLNSPQIIDETPSDTSESYVVQQFSNISRKWEDVDNGKFASFAQAKEMYQVMIKAGCSLYYLRIVKSPSDYQ